MHFAGWNVHAIYCMLFGFATMQIRPECIGTKNSGSLMQSPMAREDTNFYQYWVHPDYTLCRKSGLCRINYFVWKAVQLN